MHPSWPIVMAAELAVWWMMGLVLPEQRSSGNDQMGAICPVPLLPAISLGCCIEGRDELIRDVGVFSASSLRQESAAIGRLALLQNQKDLRLAATCLH
jgi:hypothetical protein